MWAQYRCSGDAENTGYWLNVARANHCLNAFVTVDGDCSSPKRMEWTVMDEDTKQFNMLQWDGNYDDPRPRTGFRPCGLLQHTWEVAGSACENNPLRFAYNDAAGAFGEDFGRGDLPIFLSFQASVACPFFEFCW